MRPYEVYELIEQLQRKHQLKDRGSYLCHLSGVSRSGYYAWLKGETNRQIRTENADKDVALIEKIFDAEKGKVGALQIKMFLENDYGIIMNHKKIRRLMKKYHLTAKIRQAKPYKHMLKATKEHRTCRNLLKRKFNQNVPDKVYLTDITYIYYGNGQKAYLSCIKDSTTKEIVTHVVSRSLKMNIVYQTLKQLKERADLFHPEALLHSDQGVHYTHPEFQHRVKQMGLRQSMSRRGNCWDNAPMESFFGHFKDIVDHKACETFEELKHKVGDYITKYNNERYQWGLKKMTPIQYRDHLLTA